MTRFEREPLLFRLLGYRVDLFHFDFALAVLWLTVTAAQFKFDELLLYPMALYFTYAVFRDRHVTWQIVKRGWPLLLFPTWWIASTLWSPESAAAFRSGLQSFLTVLICMFLASRLNRRQLLLVGMIALTIVMIRSMPNAMLALSYGTVAKGIFVHKNSFGGAMSILCVCTLGILLLREWPKLVRLFALGLLPVALIMLFASKSATAIIVTCGLFAGIIGGILYFGRTNWLSPFRVMLMSLTVSSACVLGAVAVNTLEHSPIDIVLASLGKDRSLTGRTDLWSIAQDEIAERPMLGTGASGYWRYDEYHLIRQIYIDHYKKRYSSFHFHNSWLNISVEFGLVGAGLAAMGMFWAFASNLLQAFKRRGPEDWAFVAIGVAVLIRTMVESELFVAFVMLNMLFFTSALIPPAKPAERRERSAANSREPLVANSRLPRPA